MAISKCTHTVRRTLCRVASEIELIACFVFWSNLVNGNTLQETDHKTLNSCLKHKYCYTSHNVMFCCSAVSENPWEIMSPVAFLRVNTASKCCLWYSEFHVHSLVHTYCHVKWHSHLLLTHWFVAVRTCAKATDVGSCCLPCDVLLCSFCDLLQMG